MANQSVVKLGEIVDVELDSHDDGLVLLLDVDWTVDGDDDDSSGELTLLAGATDVVLWTC